MAFQGEERRGVPLSRGRLPRRGALGKGTCSVTVDAVDVAAVALRAGAGVAAHGAPAPHPAAEPPELRLTRLASRTGEQGWRPWMVLVVDGEVVLVSVGAQSLDDYPLILGGRQPDARQDWDGRGRLAVCRAVRALQLILDRRRAAAAAASPPSATRRRLGRHRTVSGPTPLHRLP